MTREQLTRLFEQLAHRLPATDLVEMLPYAMHGAHPMDRSVRTSADVIATSVANALVNAAEVIGQPSGPPSFPPRA